LVDVDFLSRRMHVARRIELAWRRLHTQATSQRHERTSENEANDDRAE
jgi:hypothetical protein